MRHPPQEDEDDFQPRSTSSSSRRKRPMGAPSLKLKRTRPATTPPPAQQTPFLQTQDTPKSMQTSILVETPVCPLCGDSIALMDDTAATHHVNQCLDASLGSNQCVDASLGSTQVRTMTSTKQASITHYFSTHTPAPDSSASTPQTRTAHTITSTQMTVKTVKKSNFIQQNTNTRTCPWYKKIPDTPFAVDAFNYGPLENCTGYFLSHFHADHYGGLTSKFNYGTIYCSQVTKNLVCKQLSVKAEFIVALPMNTPVQVDAYTVTLIDANHCPGAVLFLFDIPSTPRSKLILHTGDFRACVSHLQHPSLSQLDRPLDAVYLDTTYCSASHVFPAQEKVIDAAAHLVHEMSQGKSIQDILSPNIKMNTLTRFMTSSRSSILNYFGSQGTKKSKTLVLVGSYTIGKERIWLEMARRMESLVFVQPAKRRILSCLEDKEMDKLLTKDPLLASIHIVAMSHLKAEWITQYLAPFPPHHFNQVISFRPTGWTFKPGRQKDGSFAVQQDFTLADFKPFYHTLCVTSEKQSQQYSIPLISFGIPYSEHSSFHELKMFLQGLPYWPLSVIPTVNTRNWKEMQKIFQEWKLEKYPDTT